MSRDEFFRLPDGRTASLFRLRLPDGFGADITDFGGCLRSLYTIDRHGELRDVVLGWKNPETYLENPGYLGALIGRVPNRISGGRFTLDGKIYQMCLNDQDCCTLHGGFGFSHRLWEVKEFSDTHLTLALSSPDGDGGFPGALEIFVTYRLTAERKLVISYRAQNGDRKTVLDLTSHAYFNLEGENSGRCDTHFITLAADKVTEVDEHLLPTGNTPGVTGTRFDLRSGKSFRTIFNETPGGFDDNFIIGDCDGKWHENSAVVYAENSGIRMKVHTSRPGIQFYMGGFLPGTEQEGKSGIYERFSGFCLETQCWPDSVNHPEFPQITLQPGELFQCETVLEFDYLK